MRNVQGSSGHRRPQNAYVPAHFLSPMFQTTPTETARREHRSTLPRRWDQDRFQQQFPTTDSQTSRSDGAKFATGSSSDSGNG